MEEGATSAQRHCFRSRAPEQTRRLGVALARALGTPGSAAGATLIALVGPLGAGKTLFVKGLAEGMGVDPDVVSSPTFVLANQYFAADGLRLDHVDFYRLDSGDELEAIGFFDLLEPGAIVAVEWADRFREALPRDRLEIALRRTSHAGARVDARGRELEATATGARSAGLLEAWLAQIAADAASPSDSRRDSS